MKPRKLAEVWEVDGGYQLRVIVGAFQRALTGHPAVAEEIASYEVLEVLRKILREADADKLQYRADSSLPPPETGP